MGPYPMIRYQRHLKIVVINLETLLTSKYTIFGYFWIYEKSFKSSEKINLFVTPNYLGNIRKNTTKTKHGNTKNGNGP